MSSALINPIVKRGADYLRALSRARQGEFKRLHDDPSLVIPDGAYVVCSDGDSNHCIGSGDITADNIDEAIRRVESGEFVRAFIDLPMKVYHRDSRGQWDLSSDDYFIDYADVIFIAGEEG